LDLKRVLNEIDRLIIYIYIRVVHFIMEKNKVGFLS
jgi:hypothetical protein